MMKRSILAFAACAMVVAGAAACKKQESATAPAPHAQPAAAQVGNTLSGKVAETMNAGGYTYLSVENNGQKTWVAIPETKVKVGQQVTCEPGMEMKNFTSKTLKRTFESIIFSSGIR